ncbi:MAG: hypothetical protein ACXWAU_02775 [Usitatibacter sp.]
MTAFEGARLLLVPAAVWFASLAGRRWGHTVSGYLGGLPLIGGPITFYLAIDHGADFAARSATVTLAVIAGQAAHLLAFAHASRRMGWLASLLLGWSAFTIVAFALAQAPLDPATAAVLAAAGLAAAWKWLPHAREDMPPPAIPAAELRLRLVAALGLAFAIVWSARAFGPVVSGVLLSVPVTGSIMPPFTLALYGPGAVARLTRGFVVGLCGFGAFFLVIAATVVSLGITTAFLGAICAALWALFAASRVLAKRAPR